LKFFRCGLARRLQSAAAALGCETLQTPTPNAGFYNWMNLRDFRDNGKRFVVCADEKLTAFIELEKIARDA